MGFSELDNLNMDNQREIDLRPTTEQRARDINPERMGVPPKKCPFYQQIDGESGMCDALQKTYSLKHCSSDKENCEAYISQFGGSK